MDIADLNRQLNKLWATTISQTIVDLNEPSIEFRIVAIEDDHHSTVYRLTCYGLASVNLARSPVHWNYTELSEIGAKKTAVNGHDGILLELDLWSDSMRIECVSIDLKKIASG